MPTKMSNKQNLSILVPFKQTFQDITCKSPNKNSKNVEKFSFSNFMIKRLSTKL